jgi:hypothetical protein
MVRHASTSTETSTNQRVEVRRIAPWRRIFERLLAGRMRRRRAMVVYGIEEVESGTLHGV